MTTEQLGPRVETFTCQACETVYEGPDAELAAARCEQRDDAYTD